MKRFWTILVVLIPTMMSADVLTDMVMRNYDVKPMPVSEQDSILNGVEQEVTRTNRYGIEWGEKHKLYRHSFWGECKVVDRQKKTSRALADTLVREAVMSSNGKYIAYVRANNIWMHKLDFGTDVQVTNFENKDILAGHSDWLYEEEFGVTCLMAFSPDSKQLAFVRLDETEVPTFGWQEYLPAEGSDMMAYPRLESLRYPKAGCTNAKATVWVYDIHTKNIRQLDVNKQREDVYIPRLRWTGVDQLAVMTLSRDQNAMRVWTCDTRSTVCHPLIDESSRKYFVDYALFDEWQWLEDGRIVVLSEQNGWRSAYLYSAQGAKQKQLTPDGIDITSIYGVDEKQQILYYQAATTPSTRDVYAVSLKKGAPRRLTTETGWNDARLSADYKRMLIGYQSVETPHRYTLYSVRGLEIQKQRLVADHEELLQQWQTLGMPVPEFTTISTERGDQLEAMLLKPVGYEQGKQYPLVVMHYSGPASQRVLNRWRKRFDYALANEGYMVLWVDVRGTDCRGREWRNRTYMHLGAREAEDLCSAGRWAAKRDDVDGQRMAICGWSYGGYATLMTLCQPNHPFRAGISIAPVTDWRLYDSAYTERYMRRPQVNETGYDEASLLSRMDDLTGELLLVHGVADDNVHSQNALLLTEALVQADKQFDMQLYTDDNHQLSKRKNAVHMHRRLLRFLKEKM